MIASHAVISIQRAQAELSSASAMILLQQSLNGPIPPQLAGIVLRSVEIAAAHLADMDTQLRDSE